MVPIYCSLDKKQDSAKQGQENFPKEVYTLCHGTMNAAVTNQEIMSILVIYYQISTQIAQLGIFSRNI